MKWLVHLLNDAASTKKASMILLGCILFVFFWLFYKDGGYQWGVPDAVSLVVVALLAFSSSVIVVSFFEWSIVRIGQWWGKKREVARGVKRDLELRDRVANAIPHMSANQRVIIYLLYQGESPMESDGDVRLLVRQNVVHKVLDLPGSQSLFKLNPSFLDVVSVHVDDIFQSDFVPWFMRHATTWHRIALNMFYTDEYVERNSEGLVEVSHEVFGALCDLVKLNILFEEVGEKGGTVVCLSPAFIRCALLDFYRREPAREKVELSLPEEGVNHAV
ncbi:hypothetical protein [Chromohalobacter israelensis]|uniref:hypothetical protein n=1 Tax=Chromohalobacter israelensis TaxID=141390 RepID=UPI00265C8838|nr:hypothetical protein [Chromohalobacter salexigens]MDO0944835.1 hypothetical protein [Chromohalobacter salexigens]